MGWPRRLLLRLLLRLLGPVVGTDTDHVRYLGICPSCAVWVCPDCRYLILTQFDHAGGCRRAYRPHAGGE